MNKALFLEGLRRKALQQQLQPWEQAALDMNAQISTLQSIIDGMRAELAPLKEFARHKIMEICWGYETDGCELQELAEKLGLVVPHIATEVDVDDESDYEVGDRIFVFSDILKGNGE